MDCFSDIPLGELFISVTGGGTPPRNVEEYWNGNIPWASVKDFSDEVLTLEFTQESITELGLLNSTSKLIREGTPIVCLRMGVGRAAVAGINVAINQDLKALYTKSEVDPVYIVYLLSFFRTEIESRAIGSTVKGITTNELLRIKVPFPLDFKVQQKIAHILNTTDKLIEHTQALIDKYTTIKQGMMADLFTRGIDLSGTPDTNPNYGQLRPSYNEAPELYKETELGWVPREWGVISLSENFRIKHGYAFKGENFSDRPPGEVLLTPGNFHRDGGLYFEERNTKYYNGEIPNEYILNNGDLLVVMTDLSPQTLILGRFVLLNKPFMTLHNQRIGKVEDLGKLEFDHIYLLNVLNQEMLRKKIVLTATGTTVRHSSPQRILDNQIPYPSLNEQFAIGDRILNAENLIKEFEEELEKYKEIKIGLMQDLLTGKI